VSWGPKNNAGKTYRNKKSVTISWLVATPVVIHGSDSEHSNISCPTLCGKELWSIVWEIRVLPTFGSQQRHDVSEMSCSKDVGLPNDQRNAEHWDAMRVVIEGALWESI
jgi:hypothetical protein